MFIAEILVNREEEHLADFADFSTSMPHSRFQVEEEHNNKHQVPQHLLLLYCPAFITMGRNCSRVRTL
jgi:hypothetical protein